MIHEDKCLVVDIDGTLCRLKQPHQNYEEVEPVAEVVHALRRYKAEGFHIILATSRNMRTYRANLGLIMANTAPILFSWLARHGIPYDEIHFGKPWPGKGGFYVDDRAVRPSEFRSMSYEELLVMLSHEQAAADT